MILMCIDPPNLDKACTENIVPSTSQTMSGILTIEFSLTDDNVLNSLPQKSRELAVVLSKLLDDSESGLLSGWIMGPVKVFENGISTVLTPNASKEIQSSHIHPTQRTSLKNIKDCKRLERHCTSNFTPTDIYLYSLSSSKEHILKPYFIYSC